jgi:pimeloyl-ACP methyl ester carboxylesterase
MARGTRTTWPFLAGVAAGVAAARAWNAAPRRSPRRLDPRLIRALPRHGKPVTVVFVPGIMGSQLLRPDGTEVWLNLGNVVGHHDLRLPGRLPFVRSRDDLQPGLLVGTDAFLPRAFGFTEYADFLELMEAAKFEPGLGRGHRYAVFAYDWRRDLVEAARGLAERLEGLAAEMGDPDARFHLVGHSMGGLVVRYYLRFGGEAPRKSEPVRWRGARRAASALLVATPNGGGIAALGAILNGERVGFSHSTLAASVVRRMPSIYQLLPPAGTGALVDPDGRVLPDALHDAATWERFGWGPFAPDADEAAAADRSFVAAALDRARAVHEALARPARTTCPVPVCVLGGDCVLTAARAIVGEGPVGTPPRFEAHSEREQELLFEAGDGRVTRSSVLGTHLPAASASPAGCGYPEVTQAFIGNVDHHGLYGDAGFQSLLLRLLLRPLATPWPAAVTRA